MHFILIGCTQGSEVSLWFVVLKGEKMKKQVILFLLLPVLSVFSQSNESCLIDNYDRQIMTALNKKLKNIREHFVEHYKAIAQQAEGIQEKQALWAAQLFDEKAYKQDMMINIFSQADPEYATVEFMIESSNSDFMRTGKLDVRAKDNMHVGTYPIQMLIGSGVPNIKEGKEGCVFSLIFAVDVSAQAANEQYVPIEVTELGFYQVTSFYQYSHASLIEPNYIDRFLDEEGQLSFWFEEEDKNDIYLLTDPVTAGAENESYCPESEKGELCLMSQFKAHEYCQQHEMQLPNIYELAWYYNPSGVDSIYEHENSMTVLKKDEENNETQMYFNYTLDTYQGFSLFEYGEQFLWSSSNEPAIPARAYVFKMDDGDINVRLKGRKAAVVCVE